MDPKSRSEGKKTAKRPERLDETNTNILRKKIARKDPNPGATRPPPSQ